MRMLVDIQIPNEPFNTLMREGTVGEKIGRCVEALHAENVYFTEFEGQRGLVAVLDVKESSQIPQYCEPFFLLFNAAVKTRIAMTQQDLGKAGLDKLGKQWTR